RFQNRQVTGRVYRALAAADVNDDGTLDLLAVAADGGIDALIDEGKGASWQVEKLVAAESDRRLPVTGVRLVVADMDNNGAPDLVVLPPKGGVVYLADEKGKYTGAGVEVPVGALAVGDINDDGRLDFIGLSKTGGPAEWMNTGSKDYRSCVVRPRAW